MICTIAQLIIGISRVFQRFIRHFSGTIISTPTLPAILPSLLLAAVLPVIFVLKFNESVSLAPLKLHHSQLVHLYNIAISFQMFSNNYHSIYSIQLYIGITISIYSALSIAVLFILLMQLVNVNITFLNIIFLLVLFVAVAPRQYY